MRICIHIYNYLLQKIRIIIFCIKVQGLTEQRDIRRNTCAVIPSLFLIQISGNSYFSTAGKQIIIFCQHMIGSISFPCRKTEIYKLIRIIFDMCPRGNKKTVHTTVISSYSTHKYQFIFQIIGILHISSRNRFFFKRFKTRELYIVRQTVSLIISVIIKTQTGRKTMPFTKFSLEQQ